MNYVSEQTDWKLTCTFGGSIKDKKVLLWFHKEHLHSSEELIWQATGENTLLIDEAGLNVRHKYQKATNNDFTKSHSILIFEPETKDEGYFKCNLVTKTHLMPYQSTFSHVFLPG